MSYVFSQYGEGFDIVMPEPQALRFNELIQLRGQNMTIIWQTVTGYDDYGQPVKSETSFSEHGILKRLVSELTLPLGYVKENTIEVLMRRWAPLDADTCELEIDGSRYHIIGVEKTPTYLRVSAELEVSQ